MTTLTSQSMQPNQLRMVIADQRGAGRPDFNYQARVLYADSVAPASLPASGGTITITGTGFRTGKCRYGEWCCGHGHELESDSHHRDRAFA